MAHHLARAVVACLAAARDMDAVQHRTKARRSYNPSKPMKPFIDLLASANARTQRSEENPQVMNGPDGCPRPAPEGKKR